VPKIRKEPVDLATAKVAHRGVERELRTRVRWSALAEAHRDVERSRDGLAFTDGGSDARDQMINCLVADTSRPARLFEAVSTN